MKRAGIGHTGPRGGHRRSEDEHEQSQTTGEAWNRRLHWSSPERRRTGRNCNRHSLAMNGNPSVMVEGSDTDERDPVNQVSFISFAVGICCLNSYGQTNSPLALRQLFSPPSLRLRPLNSEPEKLDQVPTAVSSEKPQSPMPLSQREKISTDVGAVSRANVLPGQMYL